MSHSRCEIPISFLAECCGLNCIPRSPKFRWKSQPPAPQNVTISGESFFFYKIIKLKLGH